MTDLVGRLRDAYPATQDFQHTILGDLMNEAAARIEELGAANRGLVRLNEATQARADHLAALLKEAEEALVEVERIYYMEATNPDPKYIRRMAAKMRAAAQDALARIAAGKEEREMSEVMMKAMQIRLESLERQVRQLAEENAGVRGCLSEFDRRHDADQAALAAERETMAVLAKALKEHHLWHLAQDRDSSSFDFDPVEAYEESGMYERTTAALARLAAEREAQL